MMQLKKLKDTLPVGYKHVIAMYKKVFREKTLVANQGFVPFFEPPNLTYCVRWITCHCYNSICKTDVICKTNAICKTGQRNL